jgi:hypothetical protein
MWKPIILGAALGLATLHLPGASLAQQTAPAPAEAATQAPATAEGANPDQCLKSAFELAEKAENKKFSNDEIDKLEEMLTRMEGHCDARQYPEAQAMAKEITALIEQKN